MIVFYPWCEGVQFCFLQVEPQFDRPCLDELTIDAAFPLEYMINAVGDNGLAIAPGETFNDFTVWVEGFNSDRAA